MILYVELETGEVLTYEETDPDITEDDAVEMILEGYSGYGAEVKKIYDNCSNCGYFGVIYDADAYRD